KRGSMSGRERDECYGQRECRMVYAMDTRGSTCILSDVVAVGYGTSGGPRGTVMTAAYFRTNMPVEWRQEYETLLAAAQQFAAERSRHIKPIVWKALASS